MRCNYCGLALAADDVAPFHEICRLEVGPLHSCPDCHTSPCTACDPDAHYVNALPRSED